MKSIFIVFPSIGEALALKPLLSCPSLSWSREGMWSVKLWAAPSPQPQLQGCSWDPRLSRMGWLWVFSGYFLKLLRDWRGEKRRKKPKLWAGMSRRWGLYPGRCYVGAEQGLQDWASWTWIPFGNQPTGTWTGDNCHVSTDGVICPYVQLGLEAGLW